ncbi:MAG: DUF5317 domain-containing protein [Chloroflexi bacterium]|nr:DUF5317 domain-containing protein [Chloroflexota bacterium]
MILLVSIGLAIVVALLLGGRLIGLARVPFRLGWLAFLALGLQVAAVFSSNTTWLPLAMLVGSYLLLLAVILANIRTPGIALLGLGLVANMAVIAANGGFMPVTVEAVSHAGLEHLITTTDSGRVFGSKDIVLPYSDTRLWVLSDIIVIRKPTPAVLSLGDLMLAGGAFWFTLASMCSERRGRAARSDSEAGQ